jgi:hypothetical protein
MLSGKLGPLSTDKQRRSLERINTQGKFLLNLINNLLGLSKMEEVEFKLVKTEENLRSVIDEVLAGINPLLLEKSLNLSLDITEEFPFLLVDRDKIQQVFINLFDNAIKYTPKGGQIILACHAKKQWIQIDISDSGEGIPLNKITHIFDRFFQVGSPTSQRVGGVGLGLAIVKEIVEGHGGRVWVESKKDHGSTFSFYLPKIKGFKLPKISLACCPCASDITLPLLYSLDNDSLKTVNLDIKMVADIPKLQELLEKKEISGGLMDPALLIFLKKTGLPLKIIQWAARCGSSFVLGKDHLQEKFFSQERKSIGIPNRFSLQNILTQKILKGAKIIPFPPLTLIEMLEEGEIEGAFLPEPYAAWAEILGIGRAVGFACEILPHFVSSCFFVLEDLFEEQKDYFNELLSAYNKNLKNISLYKNEFSSLMGPFFGLPSAVMEGIISDPRRMPHFDNLKCTLQEMRKIFEEMQALGLIENEIKVEELLFLTGLPFHTGQDIF